jgi:hypothetical protein
VTDNLLSALHTYFVEQIDPDALRANLPTPAEFERLLREKYEPILSAGDYAKLREKCGLGPVIDGEMATPRRELTAGSADGDAR